MIKKIFISFILILLIAIGLFIIGVLSWRLKNQLSVVSESSFSNKQTQNFPKGVGNLQNVFKLSKANDIEIRNVSPGKSVLIDKILLESSGFAVVYKSDSFKVGDVLGYSRLLPKGTSENVEISLKKEINEGQIILIALRIDDGDSFFEYTGRFDKFVTRADGKPIVWKVQVGK